MTKPATATATPAGEEVVVLLPLDALIEAPDNPRGPIDIDEDFLESIRSSGIRVPLIVTGGGLDAGEYVIVAGHRRKVHAAKAGLTAAPCIVRHYTEAERLAEMLRENSHRKDIDPVHEATTFKRLSDLGVSQRQIASQVGCTQSHVSKRCKLLKLPESVLERVGGDTGQVTIDMALDMADLPPASLKRVLTEEHAGDLRYAIESEIRRVKATAARQQLLADLQARGVTVAKNAKSGWKWLHRDWQSKQPAPPDGHASCAVAVVAGVEWATPAVEWHCTDPASHGDVHPPEQGEIDGAVKPMELERQARDEAAARRRDLVTQIFASIATADLVTLAAQQAADELLGQMWSPDQRLVARLLGCDTAGAEGRLSDDERTAVDAEIASDPVRALVAVVLASAEVDAPHGHRTLAAYDVDHSRMLRRHYQLLQAHGYELTDEEATALNQTGGAAAEDAA